MAAIVVLGGAGGVGRVAAGTLAHIDDVDEVVVADARSEAAEAAVADIGDPRFTAASVDVTDTAALGALVEGADVVLNCVGPVLPLRPADPGRGHRRRGGLRGRLRRPGRHRGPADPRRARPASAG